MGCVNCNTHTQPTTYTGRQLQCSVQAASLTVYRHVLNNIVSAAATAGSTTSGCNDGRLVGADVGRRSLSSGFRGSDSGFSFSSIPCKLSSNVLGSACGVDGAGSGPGSGSGAGADGGDDALNSGDDSLDGGDDVLSCGDDNLGCGDDALGCGECWRTGSGSLPLYRLARGGCGEVSAERVAWGSKSSMFHTSSTTEGVSGWR